jgi:hypothetical protein
MRRVPSRVLFPTDAPLAADRMIGRAEDVAELKAQLGQGVHRIVAAPRRTGKSTVCRAVIEQLALTGSYTVSVSLFELTSAAALAERLAQQTIANRGPLAQLVERVRSGGEAVLKGAALALSVRAGLELGEGVELALRPGGAAADPRGSMLKALALLETIAVRDEHQLVLFVDELQEIGSGDYGDGARLIRELREILTDSPHVTCLFAGSVEHTMRELFTNRQRALYGFGGFHELTPITAPEWLAGLTERFAEDSIVCDQDALDQLVARGRGHPRTTMLLAQQAHVALVEDGSRRLDLVAAGRGYASAMAAERARHVDAVLDVRRLGAGATRVVTNLARGEPTYSHVEAKAARRALDSLSKIGVVSRGTRRGEWSINDPLLADYLTAGPVSG